MSSVASLLAMKAAPSPVATSSAVKADLRRLAGVYVNAPTEAWPRNAERAAMKQLALATARDLLADHISEDTLVVIDAALDCDAIQVKSVFGDEVDYRATLAELHSAADTLGESTFAVCRVHMGETQ